VTKVEFYSHVRADGGRRCGLNVDGFTALEAYVPSDDEDAYDPVLRWFCDVRTTSFTAISDPTLAKQWLKQHEADLKAAILNAAEQLKVGLDNDSLDWNFPFAVESGSFKQVYEVVVGGQNRFIRRDFGRLLNGVVADWELFLPIMEPSVLVMR